LTGVCIKPVPDQILSAVFPHRPVFFSMSRPLFINYPLAST
jgi:hypothetical protein